jgi:hypothetical protein
VLKLKEGVGNLPQIPRQGKHVIVDIMSVLQKLSLVSALNCSLLGNEQTNTVQKALAFIISISTLFSPFIRDYDEDEVDILNLRKL